jgi:DNA topoisomerase-1
VKCGEETRSLPNDLSPTDVTLQQALDLLAQPKPARGRAARKEPLKVFDPSPVTGKPVQLLAGRYGPYVTDGATNASLPRGTSPDEVTVEYALNLLKTRAERGPSARPARGRRGAKPAGAAAPSAAKKPVKKAAKKKAVKKKSAGKKRASRKASKPKAGAPAADGAE